MGFSNCNKLTARAKGTVVVIFKLFILSVDGLKSEHFLLTQIICGLVSFSPGDGKMLLLFLSASTSRI